jgi:hypothetical protein
MGAGLAGQRLTLKQSGFATANQSQDRDLRGFASRMQQPFALRSDRAARFLPAA